MATFESPSDFVQHAKYVPLLKKALLKVKLDEPKKFVYFKEYPFTEKKQQCVLVDFSTQCIDDLRKKARRSPTAVGTVSLTSQNELKFDCEKGELKTIALKKYFATMGGGINEVWVDPNEVDDDAAGAPAAAITQPVPTIIPPLPQVPNHVPPVAAQQFQQVAPPIANAPARPTRPGNTPPLPQNRPAPTTPRAVAPAQTAVVPAQAAAAAVAPKNIAVPLPENLGAQEALVEAYIAGLRKADIRMKDPRKSDVLNRVEQLSNTGKYADALRVLNGLVADLSYPGVEEWALQPATRKYEVELLTEQLNGFLNLIEQKPKQPGDWKTEETEIKGLLNQIHGFSAGIPKGLLEANPKSVKLAFDLWAPLVARRKELAVELRKIWIVDQTARLVQEAGKSKSSYNVRMANNFGKEAMLELAQMAEIQAIRYKKAPLNAKDKVAQGDWHTKLEVSELAAIYGYSTADYTAIGQCLRDPPANLTDAEKKVIEANKLKFAEYIEAGKNGLKKLPAYKGPAVRCTKSLWDGTIAAIAATGVHVEKSFMSVGKQKVAGFGDIEWHFDKFTTGKDISMFSLHQTEGEILFPPGSKFKFVKGEVAGLDNKVVAFSDYRLFATHVTPETKAGKFWFVQTA